MFWYVLIAARACTHALLSIPVRFFFFVFPMDLLQYMAKNFTVLQMMCDLLPELLFFSCYVQILSIWSVHVLRVRFLTSCRIELHLYSSQSATMRRMPNLVVGLGNGFAYTAGIVIALTFGIHHQFEIPQRGAEAIFISALSLTFGVAFIIYGAFVLRYSFDARIGTEQSRQINQQLIARVATTRRLLVLLIGVAIIFLLHAALAFSLFVCRSLRFELIGADDHIRSIAQLRKFIC